MITILRYFLLIIIAIITGIVAFYKWSFQHWRKRGIPSAKASIPFGSLKNPIFEPESLGQIYGRMYKENKGNGYRHLGVFSFAKPIYMPIDLELIKSILLKDFNHFTDRGIYHNEIEDPISTHLFSLEGAKWKNLRSKLTPSFSSGKLKSMFPLIIQHASQLKEAIEEACSSGQEVDAKLMMGNYSADVIGSSAFGLDCNSFKNPNSEYRKQAQRFFHCTKMEAIKIVIFINNHDLGRFFKYCITPSEVSDFFMKTIQETINYRDTTNSKRNDLMQTLIDLKNSPNPSVRLSFEELAAQAFVFFVAAIETSSATFSFCMYELAMNEKIQERAREEVKAVLKNYGDELTYESLFNMTFVQQIIDETLRKYPPVPQLNRICTEDYKIPGTDIILEKGTNVAIPVMGIHHDEEYYPNHEEFDPERFNEVNKAKLPTCCYLPFGEGPRVCIGLRFGLMQLKVGIATLLKNFKFSLHKDTPKSLKISPYSFLILTCDDIWLNVERID